LLTNQSGTNNERKRDEIIVHRGHIQQHGFMNSSQDIYHEPGMRLHVFAAFVLELQVAGLKDAEILLEEKAAIFLYMLVTG